jgi:hypothetical protein
VVTASDVGPILVVLVQITFIVAVLVVWVNHVHALWRFRQANDGLHRFRIVSVVQGLSFIAFGFWRLMVWIGVVMDDPTLYTHPDTRWPADLLVWTLMAFSAVIVAHLYYGTGRD